MFWWRSISIENWPIDWYVIHKIIMLAFLVFDFLWHKYLSQLYIRVDSRFVPSQWETVLLCNDVSHWLGTSLESGLIYPTCAKGIKYSWLPIDTFCNWIPFTTVKPVYSDHLTGYFSAFWSSSRSSSNIVSKCKLVPSVFIKTHYWINHR